MPRLLTLPTDASLIRKIVLLLLLLSTAAALVFWASSRAKHAGQNTAAPRSSTAPMPVATLSDAQVPAEDAERRSIRFIPPAPGPDGAKPLVHIVYPSSSAPNPTGKTATTNIADHH